jgi:hypothetical protein
MADRDPKAEFWNSLLKAVEVEPRSARAIRGASGFEHPIVSVGVDEGRRRVVIISGEGDARSAALAHGDIQAAMPSVNVMMARPVAVNLAMAAGVVSELIGRISIGPEELQWMSDHQADLEAKTKQFTEAFTERTKSLVLPIEAASLNWVAVWKEIVQQLSLIEMESRESASQSSEEATARAPTFHLRKLIALDPVAVDRGLGVCSVPLYDIDQTDVQLFQAGTDIDAVREVLRRQGILQYFFPAPDQLALGLAERAPRSTEELVEALTRTPDVGHPFGEFEFVDSSLDLNEVIVALREGGWVVEGEAGVEVTPQGKSVRAQVRFKPREGLLSRLANVFSVKLDLSLKDLFKPT